MCAKWDVFGKLKVDSPFGEKTCDLYLFVFVCVQKLCMAMRIFFTRFTECVSGLDFNKLCFLHRSEKSM